MPSDVPDIPAADLPPSTDSSAADASSSQDSQIQSLHQQLQSALSEIGKLRQRALAESQSYASLSGLEADFTGTMQLKQQQEYCVHSVDHWYVTVESVWRPAWDGFSRGFVLAYGIRAGLGTMTRALALARAGQYKDLQGWRLVSERGLQYRSVLPVWHTYACQGPWAKIQEFAAAAFLPAAVCEVQLP